MDNLRIGIYTRISDNQDGQSLGVQRQKEDCEKLAELRGWQVAKVYEDDNLSAFQRKVTRPAFEQMLEDLKSGKIDGVICYHIDRVARRLGDIARLFDIYTDKPHLVFACVSGGVDISEPSGRAMAGFLVTIAGQSSEDTRRRVARQKLARATNGDVSSNYPPFGWNRDGTLNEKAEYLREAIAGVFDGIGPPSIVVRWQQQGLKTERGKEWTSHALTRILISPRIAGISFYKKEILTDEDGIPIKGIWEPLVDEDTWRQLVEILGPKGPPKRRKKALLSGLARCGLCGKGMVRYSREARGEGKFSYGCRGKDSGGCAGVSINGNRLDELVTELIFTFLENREVEEDPKPFPGQARLSEIAAKKKELMREYTAGLSGELVFPSIRKLEAEESTLRSASAKHTPRRKVTTTKEEWPTLPLERQQAIARDIFEAIVIAPSGRTGFYDQGRINVIWRAV